MEDEQKEVYDFVVFNADGDRKIANEIHSLLESDKHGLHGYCKSRDGELGGYLVEEIMDVIQQSKKIILLLSKISVNEGKFNFCSVASMTDAIKQNARKIIPVVLDERTDDPGILPVYIQHLRCIHYSPGYEKQLLKCFGKDVSTKEKAAESFAMQPQTMNSKKRENSLPKRLSQKLFSSLQRKT